MAGIIGTARSRTPWMISVSSIPRSRLESRVSDKLVSQHDGRDPEPLGKGPLHVGCLGLRGRQGVPRLRVLFGDAVSPGSYRRWAGEGPTR